MALDPKTKETIREEALRLSKEFAELDGRRPRVLLIEMENDLESDREERKLAANAFADSGWDVDVSPAQQPEDAAGHHSHGSRSIIDQDCAAQRAMT